MEPGAVAEAAASQRVPSVVRVVPVARGKRPSQKARLRYHRREGLARAAEAFGGPVGWTTGPAGLREEHAGPSASDWLNGRKAGSGHFRVGSAQAASSSGDVEHEHILIWPVEASRLDNATQVHAARGEKRCRFEGTPSGVEAEKTVVPDGRAEQPGWIEGHGRDVIPSAGGSGYSLAVSRRDAYKRLTREEYEAYNALDKVLTGIGAILSDGDRVGGAAGGGDDDKGRRGGQGGRGQQPEGRGRGDSA